jgi:hypothetical protein
VVGKRTGRRAKADRKTFHTSLAAPIGQAALLVKAKGQAFTYEKLF